ncbi:hypothetical protein KCP75_16210 [Salmonella enterica subsp. enterica]|nr:hypothetical protein KCP75_16210 [Salmonella enterica subsp. enterica]
MSECNIATSRTVLRVISSISTRALVVIHANQNHAGFNVGFTGGVKAGSCCRIASKHGIIREREIAICQMP